MHYKWIVHFFVISTEGPPRRTGAEKSGYE